MSGGFDLDAYLNKNPMKGPPARLSVRVPSAAEEAEKKKREEEKKRREEQEQFDRMQEAKAKAAAEARAAEEAATKTKRAETPSRGLFDRIESKNVNPAWPLDAL